MLKNGTLWSLENAAQAAKDIQFWRAEYMKRKFMQDPDYKIIKMLYDDIIKKWTAYLEKYKSEYIEMYSSNFLHHLQLSYIALQCEKKYMDDEFDFLNKFSDFFLQDENMFSMYNFFITSMHYDYFVEDLFQIADMDAILSAIDVPLPPPPLFHINIHYYQKYPEEVLTLLRTDSLDIKAPEGSSWQKNLQKCNTTPSSDVVHIGPHIRNADFIIAGQTLHDEFDIEGVCSEIKDHIAWTIYEAKRKRNQKLKPAEEKAIIDIYKRMAVGEYGATHRAARAIGLWLWDWRHRYKNTPTTDAAAVRTLKDKKLHVEHEGSDERTLLRLLENATECIKKGEIVAVKKKSGRPNNP